MKYCVLGQHGLIGSALVNKLKYMGHEVVSYPDPGLDVLINLASPTHLEFEKNVEYHMGEAIRSFELLLPFCKENDILFMYASSALVYEPEKPSPMRHCKLALEHMAQAYGGRTLGMRIFPVYGPGENRTVISRWCKEIQDGIFIDMYGDGSQERDFIYIDDVVDYIVKFSEEGTTGIVDIGAGNPVSFNEIVKTIEEELGKKANSVHLIPPEGYSGGVVCPRPLPVKVGIRDGIQKIIRARILE